MYGQVKEVGNAPSPEVANLGTFGSIPVGLYTGTPDVSVPIYTIEVGNIVVPIEAKYHLSNVKPHTPPSCLGIGWALSAGGYIARTVKGCQDEKENMWSKNGYYFNHDKIGQIERSNEKSKQLSDLTHLVGDDFYELAADEFYFSFNGYTGSFFLDKDGQWRVISDYNIKVEFNQSNGFKMISELKQRFPLLGSYDQAYNQRFFDKFTLITPDGTRYEFGGNNATEYSVPYYNQVEGALISSCWRLSRITTTDKRIVDFEYASDSYMCDIHYGPQIVYGYLDNKGLWMLNNCNRTGYTGFLTVPSRLLSIKFADEKIIFYYKRDLGYGNLFDSNSGCLYWMNKERDFLDEHLRYNYGSMQYYRSQLRFSLFLGVKPLPTENETRKVIANKITQDYLTKIEVNKNRIKILDVKFDMQDVRFRKLLTGVQFRTSEYANIDFPFALEDFNISDMAKQGSSNTAPMASGLSARATASSISSDTLRIGNAFDMKGVSIASNLLENLSASESKSYQDDTEDLIPPTKEYEYKFNYNVVSNQEKMWPMRNPLTYTDSWGYFSQNGYNTINSGEWMLSHVFVNSDFAVRPPSSANTQIYSIKDIVYPTGGKSVFQYELHDYSKRFNVKNNKVENKLGTSGGLRIKQLSAYDSDGLLLYTKEYRYTETMDGRVSSGVSKGEPCFYDRIYFNKERSDYIDFYTFEDMSPYPMNFNTPNVGYSTVFEDVKDKTGRILSRTKYKFSNYDTDNNAHSDVVADVRANVWGDYASAPFTSMAFERGKLLLKEIMDANNNVLERMTLNYVRSAGNPYSTVDQACYFDIFSNRLECSYLYKTFTNRYLESVIRTQQIFKDGTYNEERRLKYNNYGLISREDLLANNGEIVSKSYQYTFDVPAYSWMKFANILMPTQTVVSRDGDFLTKESFYSKATSGAPYVSKQQTTRAIGSQQGTKTDFTVEKADAYGNPIELVEDGVRTIMIWAYNGKRIVATVQNATYDEVTSALGSSPESFSDRTNLSKVVNQLRKMLPSALVYNYEYNFRLSLTSKTAPNGMVHLYEYDPSNRLSAVYRLVGGKKELLKTYKYNYATK